MATRPVTAKINSLMVEPAGPEIPPAGFVHNKRGKKGRKPALPPPEALEGDEMSVSQQFFLLTKNFLTAIMPQILSTSSIFISLIWAIAYLLSVVILVAQTYLTFKDYYSHPVNVEVTLETSSTFLEFPAVTVCNNNPVKKNFIYRISHLKELATLSDHVYQTILPENRRDDGFLRGIGFFQCVSDSATWIPRSWVCNGKVDCIDESDEVAHACEIYRPVNFSNICLGDYLKCPDESTCAVACDGIQECTVIPAYDESPGAGCNITAVPPFFTAGTEPKTISPHTHNSQYLNNIDQKYLIKAPPGHVIQLNITFFEVERCDNPTCWCDYFQIWDGGDELSPPFTFRGQNKLCGKLCNFQPVFSSSNQLLIKFYSDNYIRLRGWTVQYVALPQGTAPSPQDKDINFWDHCPQYDLIYNPLEPFGMIFNPQIGEWMYVPYDNDYTYEFDEFKGQLVVPIQHHDTNMSHLLKSGFRFCLKSICTYRSKVKAIRVAALECSTRSS